jgi:signal transduction histidine kinase
MTTLMSVITRIAAVIRGIALAYLAVQVAIWHSFYAADPWRLAGPVAAAAWALAVLAYLHRRRPVWPFIGIDAGVYTVLALSAGWCVPLAIRGQAGTWLFIAMASQVIIPIWFAPRVLSVPLALAPAAAYWASSAYWAGTGGGTGGGTGPPGGVPTDAPAASAALLIALVTLHWTARRMLYGRARRADLALAAADRDARDQYVILSRNIERREHDRLLHDTVLNTLTAIARAGSGEAVVGRCQHDITLLERTLSDPGDLVPGGTQPCGGLIAGIEAAAREMRALGLDVHVEVASGVAPDVPGPVAGAIAQAAAEALANVAAHARTSTAWVTVSLTPAADGTAGPPDLQVEVRDAGVGFDPARVDPARLGLRRSISERVADRGGAASIQSAPGQGTVVRLRWPAAEPVAGPVAGLPAIIDGAGINGTSIEGASLGEAAPW